METTHLKMCPMYVISVISTISTMLCLFGPVSGEDFRVVDHQSSWKPGFAPCKSRGMEMAMIKTLYREGTRRLLSAILETTPNQTTWVAGTMVTSDWQWSEGTDCIFTGRVHHVGCFQPQFIYGGHKFHNNSPEQCARHCSQHCEQTTIIALKNIYCICEENLRNLTEVTQSVCNDECRSGDPCGGMKGVSIYRLDPRVIAWARNEPKINMECAFVSRSVGSRKPEVHSDMCAMRRKYLCIYEDHHICGVDKVCVRPSTTPETWKGATRACTDRNATLAPLDQKLMEQNERAVNIPTGEFWIGLHRTISWSWNDGTLISSLDIALHNKIQEEPTMCTVIRKDGGLYISVEDCNHSFDVLCSSGPQRDVLVPSSITEIPAPNGATEGNKTDSGPAVDNVSTNDITNSILFAVIGAACGLAMVLCSCLVICCLIRCHRRQWQLQCSKEAGYITDDTSQGGLPDNTSEAPNTQTTSLSSREIIYDLPCDPSNESPFRRSQRLLKEHAHDPVVVQRHHDTEGYKSLPWKRPPASKPRENRSCDFQVPEVRAVYPLPAGKRFIDTSQQLYQVQAQCHAPGNDSGPKSGYWEVATLHSHQPPPEDLRTELRLTENYTLPARLKRHSEEDPFPRVPMDTGDLYTCVQKVMTRMGSEDWSH